MADNWQPAPDDYDDDLRRRELRRAAEADDAEAARLAEDSPTYADYLGRRADHRRRLANDE
jgi:hypothetical protein